MATKSWIILFLAFGLLSACGEDGYESSLAKCKKPKPIMRRWRNTMRKWRKKCSLRLRKTWKWRRCLARGKDVIQARGMGMLIPSQGYLNFFGSVARTLLELLESYIFRTIIKVKRYSG